MLIVHMAPSSLVWDYLTVTDVVGLYTRAYHVSILIIHDLIANCKIKLQSHYT